MMGWAALAGWLLAAYLLQGWVVEREECRGFERLANQAKGYADHWHAAYCQMRAIAMKRPAAGASNPASPPSPPAEPTK